MNGLPDPNRIYPGQVLKVPGGGSAPAPAPAPSGGGTYTVKSGDTLSGIAAQFSTSWQNLQAINGLPDANKIYPGQVLKVPGGSPAPAPAPAAQTYTVKSGDTLSGIAAKYGTSYQRLAQINNIPDVNKIYPGQVIKIG